MSTLRVPATRVLLAVAIVAAAIGGACTINPQPLPPEGFSNTPGAGGGDHVGADATTSDAAAAPPATPDGGQLRDSGPGTDDGGDAGKTGDGDAESDAADASEDG